MSIKKEVKIVHLCSGCVQDIKEYNPYVVEIKIIIVKNIEDCDNHRL
jgi:hypothetical protein